MHLTCNPLDLLEISKPVGLPTTKITNNNRKKHRAFCVYFVCVKKRKKREKKGSSIQHSTKFDRRDFHITINIIKEKKEKKEKKKIKSSKMTHEHESNQFETRAEISY